MLRELLDIALLEDFVNGLGRAYGARACIYDAGGRLIAASAPRSAFAKIAGPLPDSLPRRPQMIALPAEEPPATVGFLEINGAWYVLAPVLIRDEFAGHVAVGEFRDGQAPPPPARDGPDSAGGDASATRRAWLELAELQRTGDCRAVVTARWAARMLADRCQREARAVAAAQELALIGDIAELLTGEHDLQTVLDRIVAETARGMNCPYASLRLYDAETDELTIKAVHNLSERYLAKGPVLRNQNPIDDEALGGRMVYIEDAREDPRIRYPEESRRQGVVSGLTAGMIYRGRPVGVIRVYTNRRHRFRRTQRNLLRAVASQAATAIVHARLLEQRLRSAQTERQLELAGDVQSRMIRTPPPEHPALETAFIFDPCAPVGGDFCDFLTLPDGRLAAVVADVSGKGIPASLLMASVRGALRAGAECCEDLGELLTRLNRHVYRETSSTEFVTLLLIAVDPDRRRLTFCNAGHEPLLLLRDGKVQKRREGGLVLGIDPHETYRESSLELRPGDFALLYTDGATEAANFHGELFGRRRFVASLKQHGAANAEQVLRNIQWDIRRFVGLAERSDDLTLLGLRMRGSAGEPTRGHPSSHPARRSANPRKARKRSS